MCPGTQSVTPRGCAFRPGKSPIPSAVPVLGATKELCRMTWPSSVRGLLCAASGNQPDFIGCRRSYPVRKESMCAQVFTQPARTRNWSIRKMCAKIERRMSLSSDHHRGRWTLHLATSSLHIPITGRPIRDQTSLQYHGWLVKDRRRSSSAVYRRTAARRSGPNQHSRAQGKSSSETA